MKIDSDYFARMTSVELVREVGDIFATSLAQFGKDVDDESPLMLGLAAYQMLDLKGVSELLDKAVDEVMRIIYEGVIKQMDIKGENHA